MQKASVASKSRQLFRLFKETGSKRLGVSEATSEINGTMIYTQTKRLEL